MTGSPLDRLGKYSICLRGILCPHIVQRTVDLCGEETGCIICDFSYTK